MHLDDILVASSSHAQHLEDLRALFDRLKEFGLVVNAAKCVFGVSSINFLGYHITADGASPLPDKVAIINDFPQSTTVKQLQEFVGMINYCHRFVASAARIMQPLFAALTGKKVKRASRPLPLVWTDQMTSAFVDAKAALSKATMLAHPQPDAPVSLTVDASDLAVGGALQQLVAGQWQPLAFFSRQLQPSQRKYSTFDR